MESARTPVVFVHGLWLHADSWSPWVEHFGAAGYDASAPGWPGDSPTVAEARANPDHVAGYGLAQIVARFADVVRSHDRKPIAIGHSFGGLIVQRFAGRRRRLDRASQQGEPEARGLAHA